MEIHGFNKTTLLDYPEHVACTVFTGHCNMRCPFCHNGDLVMNPGSQPLVGEEEFFAFLKKRKNVLEGVAITGGEPTLQKDLVDFIGRIKESGLLVKLDSNGMRPEVLRELIERQMVDYLAMDIKSSKEGYEKAAGLPGMDLAPIEESAALLMENRVPYEFRTTVLKPFHSKEVFEQIADWIGGCERYYLQSYTDSGRLLVNFLSEEEKAKYASGFEAFTPEEMKGFAEFLREKGMKDVQVRGIA